MCLGCDSDYPWATPLHLAQNPTKKELVYLDQHHSFYPDHRPGFHPPAPTFQSGLPYQGQSGMYPPYCGGYGMGMGMGMGMNAPYYQNGGYYSPYSSGWPYATSQIPLPNPSFDSHLNPAYSFQHTYIPRSGLHGYNALFPRPYAYGPHAAAYPGMGPFQSPYFDPNQYGDMKSGIGAAATWNSQLAQQMGSSAYLVGATPGEIQAQQAMVYGGMGGGYGGGGGGGGGYGSQMAPYKPADGQQFWCKEKDGTWTLRKHATLENGDCSPGHWEKHAQSGYFFWVKD